MIEMKAFLDSRHEHTGSLFATDGSGVDIFRDVIFE